MSTLTGGKKKKRGAFVLKTIIETIYIYIHKFMTANILASYLYFLNSHTLLPQLFHY